jgi:hypothetical protein
MMTEGTNYFPAERNYGGNETILEKLKQYQAAGVRITLKNAEVPLDYIAEICGVREREGYMCDFIADDDNQLVELNFDEVSED